MSKIDNVVRIIAIPAPLVKCIGMILSNFFHPAPGSTPPGSTNRARRRPGNTVFPASNRVPAFLAHPRLRPVGGSGNVTIDPMSESPSHLARLARQGLAVDEAFGLDSAWIRPVEADATGAGKPAPPPGSPPGRSAPRRPTGSRAAAPPAPAGGGGDKAAHLPDLPDVPIDDVQGRTLTTEEKTQHLEQLRERITQYLEAGWPKDGWQRIVFGEGDPDAAIMFVGEGPGADEDRQGRPFVGRAGQLLDRQIQAMGLQREQVYITNIARTRPPGNRVPTPDEAARMMPFLIRHMHIIQPQVVVALGATSAKHLLGDMDLKITKERGVWREAHGFDLMPTFHPSYLLRSYTPDNRRRVWDDLQKVMKKVGLA